MMHRLYSRSSNSTLTETQRVEMNEILELIEQRNREFAQLPFFQFLRDKSIDPRQRMVWVPCLAPLAMSVKDLNACAFRDETVTNPIQKLINFHSLEDGRHWKWFLTDLERLGLDPSIKFTDTLRFLWSEETQKSRALAYTLVASTLNADPILKLVVIEAIEATGNVAFTAFSEVGKELEKMNQKHYRYFGVSHLIVETGHIHAGLDDVEEFLESIEMTEELKSQAINLVDKVFEAFTEMINFMMHYAENHSIDQPFIKIEVIPEELVMV
jgi:hypothetical protein